jgi:transaldolase / glucose-6-phosphate isomerase
MPNPPTWTLPADLDAAVRTTVRDWTEQGKVARLWARDATLWTGTDEASWLGWLGIVDEQLARVDDLRRVAQNARQAGFAHVLLLGMGGSSLCPEVLRMTFGALPGWPALSVLDYGPGVQGRPELRGVPPDHVRRCR